MVQDPEPSEESGKASRSAPKCFVHRGHDRAVPSNAPPCGCDVLYRALFLLFHALSCQVLLYNPSDPSLSVSCKIHGLGWRLDPAAPLDKILLGKEKVAFGRVPLP